jgi:hypothetical protein
MTSAPKEKPPPSDHNYVIGGAGFLRCRAFAALGFDLYSISPRLRTGSPPSAGWGPYVTRFALILSPPNCLLVASLRSSGLYTEPRFAVNEIFRSRWKPVI